jgi:plastocyanin
MNRHHAAAALLILVSSFVAAGCSKSDNKSTNPPGGTTRELSSGDISAGANYAHRFFAPGTFAYHCEHHSMNGTVTVSGSAPAGDSLKAVSITNYQFALSSVTIPIGGKVTWTNNSSGTDHTVTSDP